LAKSKISRGLSGKFKKGDEDVRKYSFPNRAIDMWNQFPDEDVCAKRLTNLRKCMINVSWKTGHYEFDSIL